MECRVSEVALMSACFGPRPRLQCQPVCLSVCLSVCLPANRLLPVSMLASAQTICLSNHTLVYLTVCLSDCMSACLWLYACLSARLSGNFKALANDSCHSFYLPSICPSPQPFAASASPCVDQPSDESPLCVLVSVNVSASIPSVGLRHLCMTYNSMSF